ncbi:NHL repeat-containing protein [Nocardia tengchongensis]|uniref:hypothetical protein n=1 Tax=Nocardia tengchongensis TaxID=2055889 RepID=UPI00368E8623
MLRTSRSRWFTVPLKTPSLLVITAIAGLALSACSGAHGSSVAAGTLDSGFGAGGKVTTDLGSPADRANAVVVQADGKIVAAGSTQDPAQGDNFAVVRYTPDGKLDSGFGDGGKSVTDFGGKSDVVAAVALQPDGKIVAVGTSHGTATGDNIALARYTSDGRLDSGFGTGGRVSSDLGTAADHGNAVAVQSDGKILVAGSTKDPVQGDNFVVLRYAPDGKLDAGFGDGGKVSTDFGGRSDIAKSIAVESDGKIVVAGTSSGTATGDNIALARYTSDGKPDSGFGVNGQVSSDLGTAADHGNAVAVQSDGKIVVVGSTKDPVQGDNFLVARYAPDGKLDSGFGDGGRTATDFGGQADVAVAVALAQDGKVVVVGTSSGTSTGDNIALARYTSDGKLDSGFGTGGQVSTDLGTAADHGNAVALQSNGDIVVAGTTKDPAQGDNFVVLRYVV